MRTGYSIAFASILSLTTFVSNAEIITGDTVVIDWEANCSDCRGDTRGIESVISDVTGNLVLQGVNGDGNSPISFDASNIISIQYDGPSNHLQAFTLFNADYNAEDQWVDGSDIFESNQFHPTDNFGAYSQASPLLGGLDDLLDSDNLEIDEGFDQPQLVSYAEFSESISGSGWFNPIDSTYDATLAFSTVVPTTTKTDDLGNQYLEYVNPLTTNLLMFELRVMNFTIDAVSNGDWSIEVNGSSYDFGQSMTISQLNVNNQPFEPSSTSAPGPVQNNQINAVSEPTTLAIFAMSLLGLAGMRKKRV